MSCNFPLHLLFRDSNVLPITPRLEKGPKATPQDTLKCDFCNYGMTKTGTRLTARKITRTVDLGLICPGNAEVEQRATA